MKKILLFILVLCSRNVKAQYHSIPKSADNAVIAPNVSLDSAINKLTAMGFTMRVVDKEKQMAATNPSLSKLTIYVRQIKDGGLAITSTYYIQYSISGIPDDVKAIYSKHGEYGRMWAEMMKFAGTFDNIQYTRL